MTNNRDNLPPEHLLDQAEKEITNGNLREGAGLVWQAAMSALSAVAEQHGLPCSNREEAMQVALQLDVLADPTLAKNDRLETILIRRRRPDNFAFFRLADMYREQLEKPDENDERHWDYEDGYWWEPKEYQLFLEVVRDYMKTLGKTDGGDTHP